MSFIMQGPYPAMKTTVLMPSPKVGNNKGNASTVQVLRAMDGTTYTYIKSKRARQVQSWDFVTSKDKAREVREFVRIHADGLVRITDHRDTALVGYVTINPFESRGDGRAGSWGEIEEAVRFTLEFEEKV
jgi:hypothetical protein